MPITLVTGRPGHGKSLFTIQHVRDTYKARKVFACNIPELDYEALGWMPIEGDPLKWMDLPTGAVIVYDEAQDFFPTRTKDKPPEHVKALERHRHDGKDIFLVTQAATQIDVHVRRLVDHHIHIVRPDKSEVAHVLEYGVVQTEPQKPEVRKFATRTWKFKYPKDVYTLYKSAEMHTVNKVKSKKRHLVWILSLTALLGMSSIVFALYSMFTDDDEDLNGYSGSGASELEITGSDAWLPGVGPNSMSWEDRRREWLIKQMPYVEHLPWTAEFFEEVYEARSFPIPYCMEYEKPNGSWDCKCHSQQGTNLDLPLFDCRYYTRNGWFNPALEDSDVRERVEGPFEDEVRNYKLSRQAERQAGSAGPARLAPIRRDR